MNPIHTSRRALVGAGVAAVGLVAAERGAVAAANEHEKKVGAVEDLMREHGVLRRALCVYSETASRLRAGGAVDPRPIHRTAQLFRAFGENYHERKLEQAHIFPELERAHSPAAALVPTLVAQHERGREITTYVLTVAAKGAIPRNVAGNLARAFDTFVLMYRNHTAREDTIVFPAWKETLSEARLDEMGARFEDIEKAQFGKDGFESAVKEMAQIEGAFGLADLARFTAPPPPKA